MELWSELFSDWVGILSFGVIVFVIIIAVYLYKWVQNNIERDEQRDNS